MLVANNIENQQSDHTLELHNALFDGPLRFYYNGEYESGVVSIYNAVLQTLGREMFKTFLQVDGKYPWLVKVHFTNRHNSVIDINIDDSIYNIYYDFNKTNPESEKELIHTICKPFYV